ncbi:MAG: hypothetical protein IPI49_19620 [Myxococcales bacterium]|nr:hypothetical protein [Myxococcales bacterium]
MSRATPPSSHAPPPGITCRWYVRGAGKRCAHYGAGGSCALPNIATCIEWLKVNPAAVGSQPTAATGVDSPLSAGAGSDHAEATPAAVASAAPGEVVARHPSDLRPPLTVDDVASFRALGVEVCCVSPALGEFWLVPAHTGKPRHELTPEHVLVLSQVLARFPGAHIAALHSPERPERRPKPRRS